MFIPKENEKDLAEIPDNVKKHLKLIPVADVDEVIAQALARRPEAIEWEEPPEPVDCRRRRSRATARCRIDALPAEGPPECSGGPFRRRALTRRKPRH